MPPAFDPYHRWLGIPPDRRPLSPADLLGLAPDERDAEVIEAALVRQSAYVRAFQAGRHGAEAARILGELAVARAALLDPRRRGVELVPARRGEAGAACGVAAPTGGTDDRGRPEVGDLGGRSPWAGWAAVGIAGAGLATLAAWLAAGRPGEHPTTPRPGSARVASTGQPGDATVALRPNQAEPPLAAPPRSAGPPPPVGDPVPPPASPEAGLAEAQAGPLASLAEVAPRPNGSAPEPGGAGTQPPPPLAFGPAPAPEVRDLGAFPLDPAGRTWRVELPAAFDRVEVAFYQGKPAVQTLNAAWAGRLRVNGRDVVRFVRGIPVEEAPDRPVFLFRDEAAGRDYSEVNDYATPAGRPFLDATKFFRPGANEVRYYHEQRRDLPMGVLLRITPAGARRAPEPAEARTPASPASGGAANSTAPAASSKPGVAKGERGQPRGRAAAGRPAPVGGPGPGLVPIFRFAHPTDLLLSALPGEVAEVERRGKYGPATLLGYGFAESRPGTVPLWRHFVAGRGHHFYSFAKAVAPGVQDEGMAVWVYPRPRRDAVPVPGVLADGATFYLAPGGRP